MQLRNMPREVHVAYYNGFPCSMQRIPAPFPPLLFYIAEIGEKCKNAPSFNATLEKPTVKGGEIMATHYKIWILAFAASLFAAPAWAQPPDDGLAEGEGPYLFVTAGASASYHACASPNQPNSATCHSLQPGFRAGLGYQYTPMWALEVNYGSMGIAYSDGYATFPAPVGPGNYNWQMRARGLSVQAVATLHMGDELSVFAKAGLARVEYDEWLGVSSPTTGNWYLVNSIHANKNQPAVGAGVRYDVGPHGSIFAIYETWGKYDVYNVGTFYSVSLTMVSGGLMWRY